MPTSYDSEVPEPDPMTIDPANLGSVDPLSVEGLFLVALSKTGTERDAFLNAHCADSLQRQRVEALLVAYEQAGDFLQKPAVAQEPILIGQYLAPCELPGTLGKLGPYEILEEIGRGGMGVVFRAHDPKLQRIVAVKALAPELARLPTARQRFLREARAAAAISHPHVVTIFAVEGTEEAPLGTERTTLPFLVMECVVGQTLHEKIKRVGALKVEEIVRISRQVAEGLTAAHKRGLIHRDIKPANILLENGVERVKITDFGLARTTSDGGITHTGEILGTPQCMSPEQARGEIVDQRSDLFSLGCVMYTMCTGVSPFRADNMLAVMKKVCEVNPRPVAHINPNVPEWLCQLVHQLLEKDPERRVQTAGAIVEVLESRTNHVTTPPTSPLTPDIVDVVRKGWKSWIPDVIVSSAACGMMAASMPNNVLILPTLVLFVVGWLILLVAKRQGYGTWPCVTWLSGIVSVVSVLLGMMLTVWVRLEHQSRSGFFVFGLAIGIFWLLTRWFPKLFIHTRPSQPGISRGSTSESVAVQPVLKAANRPRSPWSVLGWMLVAFLGVGLFGGLLLAVAVIIPAYQARQAKPMELSRVVLETHGEKIAKVTVDGEEMRLRARDVDASGRQWFMDYVGPRTLHIEYETNNPQEEKFYHSTVTINRNTTVIDAAPTIRPVGSLSITQMHPMAASSPTLQETLANMQGEWLVTDGFHYVQGGVVPYDDEFELHTRPGSKRSFVIRNDKIWHRVEFDRKETGEPYRMDIPWGQIVLREDESSQAIDLVNENDQPPETRGLYKIDGDRLQLAIAVDSETNTTKGMPRPKALVPGKNVIYFECERTSLSRDQASPDTLSQRLPVTETTAISGVNSVPLADAIEVLNDPLKMPEYSGGIVGFSEPKVRVWIDEPGLIISLRRLDFDVSEGSALTFDSRNTWGVDSFREVQSGKPAEVPPGRYQVLVQDLDYGWSVDQRGTIQLGNGDQTVHVRRRFHEFESDGDGFPLPFRWAGNSYQITNADQTAAINDYLAVLSGTTNTATADPRLLFHGHPLFEQVVTRELEGGWALAYRPPMVSFKFEGSDTELQFRHNLGTIRWSHSVPEGFKVPGAGMTGQIVYRNFRWPNAKPISIQVDPFSEGPIVVAPLSRKLIREIVTNAEIQNSGFDDTLLWFRLYATYMSSRAVPAVRRLVLAWLDGQPDVPESELLEIVKESSGAGGTWESLWQYGAVDHHLMTAILEPGSTPGTWRIKEPPEGTVSQ